MRRDAGSIRARSKGWWEIRVELDPGPDGKRRRKTVQIRGTKTEANRKLRELLNAQDNGLSLAPSKMVLRQFLAKWLDEYAETRTSPRTVMGYREKVRNYLVPSLGHVPLEKLTPQHVQKLHSEMLSRGLSVRTVLLAHRILSESLKHAVKWELLMRKVCDAVDPPKPQNREMAAFDEIGVERFLEAAATHRYGPIFFLALYTGMRRSEVLGLRWTAVDLNAKTVSVVETLQPILGACPTILEEKPLPGPRESCGNLMRPSWPVGFPSAVRRRF